MYHLKWFLSFLPLAFLLSCTSANESTLHSYYKAYNSKNYKQLDAIIADDIALIDEGDTVLKSKEAFIDMVEMGEVLHGKIEYGPVTHFNGYLSVDEEHTNDRINFFGGAPVKMRSEYIFNEGEITQINTRTLNKEDATFEKEYGAFLDWVYQTESVDSERMQQLNKEGALELKRAIQLYDAQKKD